MASSSSYKFGNLLNTYRYTLYIRGPARDITAGVVEVVLNEEGFKKTVHQFLTVKDYCSNRTVKEKLEDIEVYQNLKTKEKKRVDDAKDPLKENDITFLFWMFDKIWNKVHGQGGNFWDLMKRVKDERNAVSHEDIPLTTQELEVKLNDFGTPLNDLVTEVLNLYPCQKPSLDQLRDTITSCLSEIKERIREPLDPCSSEDYRIFLEETKKFAPQATKEIQEESKRELEGKLARHCKTVVCKWLTWYSATDTSNISVPLEVNTEKEFNPVVSQIDRTVIDQKYIFKAKSPSGEEPSVILLSGEAGAGKTTLLSLIAEHFVKGQGHGFECLLDYSLLFYTEFRNTRLENLDQYFQEVLANPVNKYGLQNVKEAIYQKQILFLCDGFDEKNPKSLILYQEILEIPSPNLKILVTTRPNCSHELTKLVNKSKCSRINLKILPLTEAAVIECMKKVVDHILNDDPIKREETTKEITSSYTRMAPEIQKIMRVPLYNSLITTLLLHAPQRMTQVNTISKLFQVIRENDGKRVLEKCEGNITEAEMKRFEKSFNERALKNHLEQRHEISSDDVDAFKQCFKDNHCFHNALSVLCSSKHSLAMLNIISIYCYRHRTDQEYSAALAVTDKILDGEFDAIRGVTDNPIIVHLSNIAQQSVTPDLLKSMHKIMAFITGILSDNPGRMKEYAQDIVNCLVIDKDDYDRYDISPIMEILSECQNNSDILDAMISKLTNEGKWDWKVKDARDLTGLEALFTRKVPEGLCLYFSIDPDTVGHLIPKLEAAASRKFPLRLHLIKHYYKGGYSDEYLRAGKNLENFTGCVKDMSCIPHTLNYLHLRMEKEQLVSFNAILPKMVELKRLVLRFDLENLDGNRCLISNEFRGILGIAIDAKGWVGRGRRGGGESNGQKMADVIHSLWPENRRRKKKNRFSLLKNYILRRFSRSEEEEQQQQSSTGKEDRIWIAQANFEKNDIETFIHSLNINHLEKIWIDDVIGVTDDDKEELRQICPHRSIGELFLRGTK